MSDACVKPQKLGEHCFDFRLGHGWYRISTLGVWRIYLVQDKLCFLQLDAAEGLLIRKEILASIE